MSDDAFALTPVAAQPQQPSEAVYQALNAALSATARGRWFLSEFARRNRNSESSKMLDAVARIEQAVAARPALAAAGADLEIARTWAIAARAEAVNLLNAPRREAVIAAGQRGTRIIREIAYSMRAVGNDPRICNILDTQLDAIEAAQNAADGPSKGVIATFDRLIAQLDELIPAPPEPAIEAASETVAVSNDVKMLTAVDPEARLAAVADLAVACATGDPKIDLSAAENDEDEAMLARIAREMADQPDDEMVIPAPQLETPTAATAEPAAANEVGLSLGESLLAQGLVPTPFKPATDPFAALKRLTQSEKVALFT